MAEDWVVIGFVPLTERFFILWQSRRPATTRTRLPLLVHAPQPRRFEPIILSVIAHDTTRFQQPLPHLLSWLQKTRRDLFEAAFTPPRSPVGAHISPARSL